MNKSIWILLLVIANIQKFTAACSSEELEDIVKIKCYKSTAECKNDNNKFYSRL